MSVIQKLKFVSNRVENIVAKGENAGYQYFQMASIWGGGGGGCRKSQRLFHKGLKLCTGTLHVISVIAESMLNSEIPKFFSSKNYIYKYERLILSLFFYTNLMSIFMKID